MVTMYLWEKRRRTKKGFPLDFYNYWPPIERPHGIRDHDYPKIIIRRAVNVQKGFFG